MAREGSVRLAALQCRVCTVPTQLIQIELLFKGFGRVQFGRREVESGWLLCRPPTPLTSTSTILTSTSTSTSPPPTYFLTSSSQAVLGSNAIQHPSLAALNLDYKKCAVSFCNLQ